MAVGTYSFLLLIQLKESIPVGPGDWKMQVNWKIRGPGDRGTDLSASTYPLFVDPFQYKNAILPVEEILLW